MYSIVWRIQICLGNLLQSTGHLEEVERMFETGRHLIEELASDITRTPLGQRFLTQATMLIPTQPLLIPRQAAKHTFGGLTRREQEVAALIAEGKSNREIADTLILSESTVEKHVANILSKLYFTSRREIAVWAVGKGLTPSM